MCYYIGIEDLAANAMIEILEKKQKDGGSVEDTLSVTLRDLEEYGAEVVRYINETSDEKALLILSRASTVYMFRNYSDFFEETDEGESAIKLRKEKTVEDLKTKFRTYKASDLINAYMAEATVKVLYAKYNC
jgi:hypothetical protein